MSDHPDGPCWVRDCHDPRHGPSIGREERDVPNPDVRCEIR